MKRLILFINTLFFALSISAVSFESQDGFKYKINDDNTATVWLIKDKHKYKSRIFIPLYVKYNMKTYAISHVGKGAFNKLHVLKEAIIHPDIIIDDGAFVDCRSLEKVSYNYNSSYYGDEFLTSPYKVRQSAFVNCPSYKIDKFDIYEFKLGLKVVDETGKSIPYDKEFGLLRFPVRDYSNCKIELNVSFDNGNDSILSFVFNRPIELYMGGTIDESNEGNTFSDKSMAFFNRYCVSLYIPSLSDIAVSIKKKRIYLPVFPIVFGE